MSTATQPPLIIRASRPSRGRGPRVEVAQNHYYNARCGCLDCLQLWIGVSTGAVVVMDHAGKRRLHPPSPSS